MKARVLFNATTNIVGGGVQNAGNFVASALNDETISWGFAVSEAVADTASRLAPGHSRVNTLPSPARSAVARFRLKKFIDDYRPDAVFTMAGPAYVNPDRLHLMGVSNPYLTHASWEAVSLESSRSKRFRNAALVRYGSKWAQVADRFLFQTETSRVGFCERTGIERWRTKVVPNAVNMTLYGTIAADSDCTLRNDDSVIVFCPAAPYPHKALHLIPEIAHRLRANGQRRFDFRLTIPEGHRIYQQILQEAEIFGVDDCISTLGVVPYSDMPQHYRAAHIVFVPSLLETFSTSYLEAMSTHRPLVVPQRGFAQEVCREGAFYFDGSASSAAAVLSQIADDGARLTASQVAQQTSIVQSFGNQGDRYDAIRAWILDCIRSANAP